MYLVWTTLKTNNQRTHKDSESGRFNWDNPVKQKDHQSWVTLVLEQFDAKKANGQFGTKIRKRTIWHGKIWRQEGKQTIWHHDKKMDNLAPIKWNRHFGAKKITQKSICIGCIKCVVFNECIILTDQMFSLSRISQQLTSWDNHTSYYYLGL